ncbi:hypothetical protein SARC_07116 [Sphaeroforma arctica JP610]|uniref:Uncharacterized protein n=1 Tax=Sphaeroforma arctica JP610 TaxID=667725 RepID=A0A0L0FX42_9EUKA|nr:hypothetical protein SARC_07116 [Sphaeroforma arctica JP610]KNC80523.1 hypothetical protein SARC_07116 [Sphaeroforma arctica JP610]|eukprot:XP_014154425.1 hypothetical protein SARC_07116 [Sphaeroforma arctica JP610]
MARQNDEIFHNLHAVEDDSGYTSSDASATLPSLMSSSGSEKEETPRPNDQHDRWNQQKESEVNNGRFRLNRISMARQLERFRLPRQVSNFTVAPRTEANNDTTTELKEPTTEPKKQSNQEQTSEVQERNEQDKKGQTAKTRVQPDDQLSRNDGAK